jgi:hypothetical protein
VVERNRGNQLLEWIIVTLLLALATYAVLQVIGPDVELWVQGATQWLTRFFRGA